MNEIKEYLKVLEFEIDEKNPVFPKLKEVGKRFRELAKVKHSDKGGDDEEFVKLYNAYNQIKKYYKKGNDNDIKKYCEGSEEEEDLIRKLFEEFNISQKNKSCFTIFIENDLSLTWDEILEDRYGKPEDKGVNGLHWSHKGYEFQELQKSDIYLRKYHKPKSDKTSKIVIQGNFELAVAFVANELPKMYKKVFDKKSLPLSDARKSDESKSCDFCEYKTMILEDLKEHENTCHIEKIDVNGPTKDAIKCTKCQLEVPNESEMRKHVKKPHKKCEYCQFQTTKLTSLKPHMEKEHGGSVRCGACDFSGIDMKVLKKHVEEDHICLKCRKPNGKKVSLECKTCRMSTHIECLKLDIGKERTDKYKSNKNEFQCKTCLEKLIGIDVIDQVESEDNSCGVCNFKTSTEDELREHESVHKEHMERCEECGENYLKGEAMTNHRKKHAKLLITTCDICQQTFKTNRDLEVHVVNHAGSSSFSCPLCKYKANTPKEVQVHMHIHDEDSTNVVKGLEESCRKLEEEVIIERKCNQKNVEIIKDLEEKIKSLSTELQQSKEMVMNEIRKNEEKQEKIDNLEADIRENKRSDNQNDENDTKIALERAKDVIMEYKSEVTRITKEKDIEVGKVMIEKIRIEEDLRVMTLEKKRLSDSERILLNTFDTLKKYYDTKDSQNGNKDENLGTESIERFNCTNCKYEAITRTLLNEHISEIHGIKNLRCSSCNFEDTDKDKLSKHITDTHGSDVDLKCLKCDYEATTKSSLSRHIADTHDIDIRKKINEGQRNVLENRRYWRQNKSTTNEERHPKKYCFYWNSGYCKFDTECFNVHEESPSCYFQERCNRKSTCQFFHANDFLARRNNTLQHR